MTFDCTACGASMAYDADVQSLACPYCGTKAEKQQRHSTEIVARQVPFRVTSGQAKERFHQWLGRGFWRPYDLRRAVRVGKQSGVFVPYWVFSAQTETRWTADISPAPPGSQGDWQPAFATRTGRHEGILVGGSNVLKAAETEQLCPFDLADTVRPKDGVAAPSRRSQDAMVREQFRVPRKMARPPANTEIHRRELAACTAQAGPRSRNVRVNVAINTMMGEPILLPVWILVYRYKSEVHRVLINGQTGKVSGTAPFSTVKLLVAAGVGVFVLAIVLALALASARLD